MPEIMRFSLYKNKVTKYILGIVLACFVIPICNAQNRHVNDFHFATWNSRGAHWETILRFMVDGRLDVLMVQESGGLPGRNAAQRQIEGTISLYDSINYSMPPLCFIGRIPGDNDIPLYLEEYIWHTPNDGNFYIYYYDRTNPHDNMTNAPNVGINIAIITRQRADRNFFMIPVNNGGAEIQAGNRRFGINRPVIGVQLENAVFFNLHAEPNDTRNEAPAVVNIIQNYMAENHSTLTWAVTGDFNRPNNTINLPRSPANTFTHLLSSGHITHPSQAGGRAAELDYGFWGGPIANQVRMASIILLTNYLRNIRNPSDHLPVKFN